MTDTKNMFPLALLLNATLLAQTPAPPTLDTTKLDPGLYATINTSMGSITALLFEKETPATVANFIGLARGTKPWVDPKTRKAVLRPLYANLIFHRVIPQFMIQTGDPTGVGNHDCGFVMKDEIVAKSPRRVSSALLFLQYAKACVKKLHYTSEIRNDLPAFGVVSSHAAEPETVFLRSIEDRERLLLNKFVPLHRAQA